jgi:hypothetical protein
MAESVHAVNGRIGALERWGRTTAAERAQQTEAARDGLAAKFEAQADPEGRMSEADRIAAGARLRSAHMRRLAKLSAARRRGGGSSA